MRAKIFTSVLVWLLSTPALLGYAILSLAFLAALQKTPIGAADFWKIVGVVISFVAGWTAWFSLSWMNVEWIHGRHVGNRFPLVGSTCAVVALLPILWEAPWIIMVVLPGVTFALFLCVWNIRKYLLPKADPSSDNDAPRQSS